MEKRVYDGSQFCGDCGCGCPAVDHNTETGMVRIHDPQKPENGEVTMTVAEYNALLANGRPIET